MKRQGWRWKTLQFWPGRCHGASLPEGFQLNPFGLWFFSAAESWSGCSVSLCLFLIRCPPELSTAWTRQTENSAGTWQNNGQSEWERHGHFFHFILVYRKIFSCSYFSSEYMSSRLFWMGVPVTAHRAHALSWHTACDVCTLGFLMLWASSRITRAQVTRIRGEEEEVFGWRKKNWPWLIVKLLSQILWLKCHISLLTASSEHSEGFCVSSFGTGISLETKPYVVTTTS